jgi:gliding motility-associated-like protein
MKRILSLCLLFFFAFLGVKNTEAQNCPGYASVLTSGTQACSDQAYNFRVANNACNGTITFNVVGSGVLGGGSWEITSNLTGAVVASGTTPFFGGNFSTTVGPLNPNVVGLVFTLTANLFISNIEVRQGGVIIASGGAGATFVFQPNVDISSATLTVNTPTGPVTQVIQSCRNFNLPLTLENPNFCSTIQVDLPWTIVCDITSAVLASGTHQLTLYPKIPTSATDLVSITWNPASCSWNVNGANDCSASDIGSIFTISPDPLNDPANACLSGSQDFSVSYLGIPGGLDCCETGGPLSPISYAITLDFSNAVVRNSPFGGTNNSAYFNIPANEIGGSASSLTLDFSLSGYCFNPPSTNTNTEYWVSIYVDGNLIYDEVTVNPGPSNLSITINLSDIPAGYDENSVIEIYVYPNSFSAGGVNTTFNPNANCANLADGHWNVSSFTVSLEVEFTDQAASPAECTFVLSAAKTCCSPQSVANENHSVCAEDLAAYNDWVALVESTNIEFANCIVYSSVTPVAGSVAPQNNLDGINNSCNLVTQQVSAFAYCDVNGNGIVDAGDTYTFISTFALSVNPGMPVVEEIEGGCDVAPTITLSCGSQILFTDSDDAPTFFPCGDGDNVSSISGVITAAQIADLVGGTNVACYTDVAYSLESSCPQASFEAEVFANPDSILLSESSVLNSLNGVSYNWLPDLGTDSFLVVSPNVTTTYTVQVTDANGCVDEASVTVYVTETTQLLVIPDAFSPNGDGVNDVFEVVNAASFETIEMRIYNRWGELIHEGRGASHGWDGTYNGVKQAPDVYVYYISATLATSSQPIVASSNVYLIR